MKCKGGGKGKRAAVLNFEPGGIEYRLMSGKRTCILLPVAIVPAVLLLIGGPPHATRLVQAFWDLGHLPAFALWTFLLLRLSLLRERPFATQVVAALLFALAGGVLAEGVQQLSGRVFDLRDIGRNLIGSALAVAFLAPTPPLGRRLLPLLRGTSAAALLFSLLPAARILADDWQARRQFPLLAGFESPLEASRWGGGAVFSRSGEVAAAGRFSLRADFSTDRYSGIFLNHFPRDWRGYRALRLDIFNPLSEPVRLHLLLADRYHRENGWRLADRFNATCAVVPGWSRITIDLEEASAAPAGRRMAMDEIECFGLFTAALPAPITLYFDDVRLLTGKPVAALSPMSSGP